MSAARTRSNAQRARPFFGLEGVIVPRGFQGPRIRMIQPRSTRASPPLSRPPTTSSWRCARSPPLVTGRRASTSTMASRERRSRGAEGREAPATASEDTRPPRSRMLIGVGLAEGGPGRRPLHRRGRGMGGADAPSGNARRQDAARDGSTPGAPADPARDVLGGARASPRSGAAPGQRLRATSRVCALRGCTFAIVIPPGDGETARDRLCSSCAMLPIPPPGPDDAGA